MDSSSASPVTVEEASKALADAQAVLVEAQKGFDFRMDLSQKIGMVVNPNGEVSKVTPDGQADTSGVSVGCHVIEANGEPTTTLEALKAALAAAKGAGLAELMVRFEDPKRAALAAVGVGRAKVTLANAEAAEAAAEADAAFAKAEAERVVAEELARVNHKAHEHAIAEAKVREEENRLAHENIVKEAAARKVAFEEEMRAARAKEKEAAAALAAETKAAAGAEAAAGADEELAPETEEAIEADEEEVNPLVALEPRQPPSPRPLEGLETKRGVCSMHLSILAARSLLASDKSGTSDPFAIAEVIDRDTGQPIDPPCKHRTLTKHKTLDPDWLESVSWQDVPRPPAALAIRVKVLDADKSLTGLAVAQPLGEVTLPLLCGSGPAEDKEHELERDGGRYLDRDYWYHLRPSPKMKAKTQLGIVQLRLSFNVAKRFDCKICGRSNTKTEAQRAGDQCRVCGAKPGRDVNPRIQPNDGVGDYLHGAFLRRQHTQFTIAREPLIIPEQEPIVTERTIRPDADEEPGTFTEKLLKSGAGF